MVDEQTRIIVVGAGQAGGAVVASLRQAGFPGELTLIGEEPLLPYQRPPLSKNYLKNNVSPDALKLRPAKFYTDSAIKLRLAETVQAIDRDAKTITLKSGETLPYDILILATGSLVRKLAVPGAELAGILALRNQSDADALKAVLHASRRIAIVGAGYVGLEVAASANSLGLEVVVIEREGRVLARVASPALSGFVADYHRARGVEILTDASVAGFVGDDRGKVVAIDLADGRRVPCDAAVVGVGALPSDALAAACGLACKNGVVVDAQARTSDPAIYAIGDMTARPLAMYAGRQVRLESVPNALEQAKQATAAILGTAPPLPEIPWFWSDQYDLKLQMAGLTDNYDRTITRGTLTDGKFALYHMHGSRVVLIESVNLPIEFMTAKTFLTTPRLIDPAALADIAIPIKSPQIFCAEAMAGCTA